MIQKKKPNKHKSVPAEDEQEEERERVGYEESESQGETQRQELSERDFVGKGFFQTPEIKIKLKQSVEIDYSNRDD